MKYTAVLAAFLFAAFFSHAQSDGMLWRISGNGLEKPSFVFGTIHLYCHHENINKQEITTAIDSSDIVAMEINLNDFGTLVAAMKAAMQPSGKSLKTLLTESEYKLVGQVCQELTGSALETFDDKTPMNLMTRLISSEKISGCNQPLPVDLTIASMAKEAGKISYGLESFKFQDSILNSIPDTTQVRWLVDLCKNIPETKEELKAMVDAYDEQKAIGLYNVMLKTSPEMEMFKDVLLVQRNIKWVELLKNNMNRHAYFMAVGAGHLAGETGVISLLRKAGYTVVPIIMK